MCVSGWRRRCCTWVTPRPCGSCWCSGADPTDRVEFLHDFTPWRGDLARLPAPLRRQHRPGAAVGAVRLAVLGLVPPDPLDAAQQERLQVVLRELYEKAADAGTHAAAGWALRRLGGAAAGASGRAAPAGAPVVRQPPRPHHGRDCAARRASRRATGGTRNARALRRDVTLTRPFFLSDREVTLDLFRQFLADPDPAVEKPKGSAPPSEEFTPSGDCPVVMVNWDDAARFGNRLSLREGRRPGYERGGKKRARRGQGGRVRRSAPRLRRRRLPPADRGGVGVRLPRRHHHALVVRRRRGAAGQLAPAASPTRTPVGTSSPTTGACSTCTATSASGAGTRTIASTARCRSATRGPDEPAASRMHRGGRRYDYSHACRSGFRNLSSCRLRDNIVGFRVAFSAAARPKPAGGPPPP